MRLARWLAIAFVAGGILMSLEMVAFRLYAPYFGYSIYVWGTMICVVMAALVGGYFLGGRLADSSGASTYLFVAILTSAAWQLLMLWILRPLLTALAPRGEIAGVVLATVAIFAPPMICLAATGPILVRLCAAEGRVGWAAGVIYALSTAGGMLGIIVTIFWLLPHFGTQMTLRSLCAASFLLGASGGKRLFAIVPIFFLPFAPSLGWAEGTEWTAESEYNLVRVVRLGPDLVLTLNRAESVQTITAPGYYYDFFAEGPRLVHARRALVLGMGGGAGIRAMRSVAPDIAIDAVEIDPKVVDAAVRFFGVANVRIHIADARRWLSQNRDDAYDIVQLDVYQGGPYIPFYLVTDEFFRLTREHMNSDALLMMNVFDESADARLLNALAATLRREFPSVTVKRTGPVNFMLYAFTQRRAIEEFVPRAGAPVFTDDRAPVEELTRAMLGR